MSPCTILFDKPTKVYQPEEELKGKLLIYIDSPRVNCKRILIRIVGGALIRTQTKKTTQEELFFSKEFDVTDDCHIESDEIQSYPFKYVIPAKQFPRRCDSKLVRVYYNVIAIITETSGRTLEIVESFNVFCEVDLKKIPKAGQAAQSISTIKTFLSNGSAPCCCGGSVRVCARIPVRSGCVGKEIEFSVTIENRSRRRIKDVKVELVQGWYRTAKFKKSRHSEIVNCISRHIEIPPGGDCVWEEKIFVPNDLFLPPPTSSLSVSYLLKFTAVSFLCYQNITCEIPVFLGDIPCVKTDSTTRRNVSYTAAGSKKKSVTSLGLGIVPDKERPGLRKISVYGDDEEGDGEDIRKSREDKRVSR